MRRRVIILFVLLLINTNANADNTLVLSNGGTYMPMHTQEFKGFVDVLLTEAVRRIGYKLDMRSLPNERSLINSDRGIIDGETQRIAGLEKQYTNLIRVPEKVMDWQFVVFSKQKIDTTQNWNSLKPYTTSFITGWKIFEYNVPKDVQITKTRDAEGLFLLLNKNRTDLVLYELWQGLALIKRYNYKDIMVSYPAMANREMFTYLHKKHALLVPKLAESLRTMKKDGSYQKLYKRILEPYIK